MLCSWRGGVSQKFRLQFGKGERCLLRQGDSWCCRVPNTCASSSCLLCPLTLRAKRGPWWCVLLGPKWLGLAAGPPGPLSRAVS